MEQQQRDGYYCDEERPEEQAVDDLCQNLPVLRIILSFGRRRRRSRRRPLLLGFDRAPEPGARVVVVPKQMQAGVLTRTRVQTVHGHDRDIFYLLLHGDAVLGPQLLADVRLGLSLGLRFLSIRAHALLVVPATEELCQIVNYDDS